MPSRRADLQANAISIASKDKTLFDAIRRALPKDPDFGAVYQTLKGKREGLPMPTTLLQHFTLDKDDLLWYDGNRLCIPRGKWRTLLLHDHHDTPIAGHQGVDRTYAALHPE